MSAIDPEPSGSMTTSSLEDAFQGLWNRVRNSAAHEALTPAMIQAWTSERGLKVDAVEARRVGAFAASEGIVLTTPEGKAFFPKIPASGHPAWRARRDAADRKAELWEKVEWFTPFWAPNGAADKLLADIEHAPKARAVELFNYHTSTIYTVAFEAVCIAQIMPAARSLEPFFPLAREAYLAFFAGYRASSIAALIPVIEGALARIVPDSAAGLGLPDKIDMAVNRAIATAARLHFEGMWTPSEYRTTDFLFGEDERVFGFETFRRWLRRSFFRNTDEYNGATWLNRHLFAHGAATSWQSSTNFSRLVVALATIGLIESWHDETHRVSIFLPEMNDDSTLLWQQALFQAQAQMQLKLIEQKRYHEHGRLVPEMPTDDGAGLRRALLSTDCIEDLVRPLRDAGWSVEVADAEETGLYQTVVATADGERFGAALLFSCGTSNAIYRQLAQTCDAILYRGAPYKQASFAHGIPVHVGPVAGWQPPKAPHRRS